jgi:hypothetical protein
MCCVLTGAGSSAGQAQQQTECRQTVHVLRIIRSSHLSQAWLCTPRMPMLSHVSHRVPDFAVVSGLGLLC